MPGTGLSGTFGDAPNEMGDMLPSSDFGAGRTAVDIAVSMSHMCFGVIRGRGSAILMVYFRRHHYRDPTDPNSKRRICILMDNGLVKCYGETANGGSGQPDTVSRLLSTPKL